tara:strand:+ start:871 stop:1431 length:561 start_codon:yes stop_codon:yes gene_type:complete
MRLLSLIVFSVVSINVLAHNSLGEIEENISFDSIQYEFIVAYVKKNTEGEYNKRGILSNGIIDVKNVDYSILLGSEEERRLIKILTDTMTYGENEPSCFLPEVGFVFYDSDSNIIAVIDISINCNHLSSSINIPAECYYDYSVGKDAEGEMMISMGGFSKEGKLVLEKLVESIKKSKYVSPSPIKE